jgi:predicted DCC family thiol-disulfide oxidoreductase YuxK
MVNCKARKQTNPAPGCSNNMESPVIFFDDVCVLCSRSVQFIHRNDRKKRFYFASLDSEAFREVRHLLKMKEAGLDSVILYHKGRLFLRSSAALRIASKLKFPWPLFTVGWILPPFIRNGLYDWIARNRYRWFGKKDQCFIPDAGMKKHFLD